MSHFQDGCHDVISRRKVLPFDECTRSDRSEPGIAYVHRLHASNSF